MTNPTGQPLVEGYALGPFATNCYLVHVPPHPDCWVIDASFEPRPMLDRVAALGLRVTHILLTHAHVDHIAGLEEVRRACPDARVLIHPAEAAFLADPMLNLSGAYGIPVRCAPADGPLDDAQTLTLSGSEWRILHTPGHSPGGITLYNAASAVAIVGDTLFAGSIGRSDFPTSDEAALHASIRSILYKLPPETRVFPGHGPATTIGREMMSNPYVRA